MVDVVSFLIFGGLFLCACVFLFEDSVSRSRPGSPGMCSRDQAAQTQVRALPPALGLEVPGSVPPFTGVPESRAQASVAGMLPTDLSPQTHVTPS